MPNETLVLKVHEIEGDGNCLYRSLSESKVVREHIPKFKSYQVMERHKYVREVMYSFTKANQILSQLIWKHYVPKKGDKDSRDETNTYESWLETLQQNKFWGGYAEYTLFAYAFKCHVICLRQLKNELQVICTREFHLKILIEKDRKRYVKMGEMFQSLSDVIFIWHHKMTAPRHKLADEKIGYGDHYSFLEYKGKKKKKFYHDTFQFQHASSMGGFVDLCSPEEGKGKKTVDNDVHTDAAVFGIEIPRNMENREDGDDTAPTTTPVAKLKTRTSISPEDKKRTHAKVDGKRQHKQISPITPKRMLILGKNKNKTQKSSGQNQKRKKTPESTVASRLEERRNKKNSVMSNYSTTRKTMGKPLI
jgi:hypothetical protein